MPRSRKKKTQSSASSSTPSENGANRKRQGCTVQVLYCILALNVWISAKTGDFSQFKRKLGTIRWKQEPAPQQVVTNFDKPSDLLGSNATVQLPPPIVGVHRPDRDAVFAVALGYTVQHLARFVGSLVETGYTGDIVLGVLPEEHLDPTVRDFLSCHSGVNNNNEGAHVIAYGMDIVCRKFGRRTRCQAPRLYADSTTGDYIPDDRLPREIAQLRFEYYWAWLLQYSSKSRIFVADGRDVYFQRNPFELIPSDMDTTLYVFEEYSHPPLRHQNSNRLWIRATRGMDVLNQIGDKTVLCSGTTVGGYSAMESYFRAMVQSFDETQCLILGCDQGHMNYLVHTGRLLQNSTQIQHIEYGKQGSSLVNTLGLYANEHKPLRAYGVLDNTTNQVLNFDGSVSPVVHQFDREEELKVIMEQRAEELFQKWNESFHSSA
ncbi:expressed unknown protein [Seminavis robusta]|uniref:Uncharacterized protein n=1 Tax=Seminavis robusta TaxID=568900 RepID=A0A9N8H592_9STRA|nr:expressed unknown protein [Seminavis robusta]|eukprot:Sro68_g038280.1 n/a (433) ;mRNA; r:104693-105991